MVLLSLDEVLQFLKVSTSEPAFYFIYLESIVHPLTSLQVLSKAGNTFYTCVVSASDPSLSSDFNLKTGSIQSVAHR